MSVNSKKSMGWTIVLMLLGLRALYGGAKWLMPADSRGYPGLVRARPSLRTGRN